MYYVITDGNQVLSFALLIDDKGFEYIYTYVIIIFILLDQTFILANKIWRVGLPCTGCARTYQTQTGRECIPVMR